MSRTPASHNRKPNPLQGVLPFGEVKSVAFAAEHPFERIVFLVVGAGIVVCALLYIYFVTASVLNVTARKTALRETAQIQSTIGVLEEEHFALSQSMTQQAAADLGLSAVQSSQYVYRPGTVGVAVTSHGTLY